MQAKDLNKVLYINLTKKDITVRSRPELFDRYLGGSGVGIKLLEEECPPGTDPLGPDNPIIFAVGPFSGIYPSASKTVAMFKSPLTGNLGESHCGGRSAISIKLAGYGAIVIKGASDIPLYLAIHGDDIHFRDASSIWGVEAYTVGRILREAEPGSGLRSIIRIGRAGEELVRYACVVCETYRHFGRLGLGAVMGSKKLKAIVVSADKSTEIPEGKLKAYRAIYDELQEVVVETDAMEKYHDLGTAGKIYDLNKIGGMAYKNLSSAQAPDAVAKELSGENLARKYLSRRVSCAHCPVGCIHLASVREMYEPGYYFKTSTLPYDNETIYALGFMLGMAKATEYMRLIDLVDRAGMDALSTGVTLAWATEAYEKGLITEEQTDGLKLAWGDVETYLKAIRKIVAMPNEFYRDLGQGVEHASRIYGGQEFALAFGGNEMPEYHTGIACYINNLAGARHSHLDSAGYDLDQKLLGTEFTLEEVVEKLLKEEEWRQILASLVVCFFARKVYTPAVIPKALDAIGIGDWTAEKLEALGREIHRAKMNFKFREGFELDTIRIPNRIFEVPTPHGLLKEDELRKALALYMQRLQAGT